MIIHWFELKFSIRHIEAQNGRPRKAEGDTQWRCQEKYGFGIESHIRYQRQIPRDLQRETYHSSGLSRKSHAVTRTAKKYRVSAMMNLRSRHANPSATPGCYVNKSRAYFPNFQMIISPTHSLRLSLTIDLFRALHVACVLKTF